MNVFPPIEGQSLEIITFLIVQSSNHSLPIAWIVWLIKSMFRFWRNYFPAFESFPSLLKSWKQIFNFPSKKVIISINSIKKRLKILFFTIIFHCISVPSSSLWSQISIGPSKACSLENRTIYCSFELIVVTVLSSFHEIFTIVSTKFPICCSFSFW